MKIPEGVCEHGCRDGSDLACWKCVKEAYQGKASPMAPAKFIANEKKMAWQPPQEYIDQFFESKKAAK